MYLSLESTAVKARPVSIVETLIVYSGFHRCRTYPADIGDLIHSLGSCTERFPFLFLSRTAPGAQLWFWPHLCVCAALRCLLLAQARGSESSGCLGHVYSLKPGQGYCGHSWSIYKLPAAAGLTGSCNRLWHARSGGVPPSAHRGRNWRMRAVAMALPPPHLSTMAPHFPGRPRFPWGHSWPRVPSLPSPLLYPHSQQHSSPRIHPPNPTL